MENHIFGEPVPVVYYSVSSNSNDEVVPDSDVKSDVEPLWTVDVIRKGSNVVVGTIVINNTKLPPRRNKNKKVVWKLPAANNTGSNEDIPRFGIQDYPRLWEIYKEEKKKRRSQNKNTIASSNHSSDDGVKVGDEGLYAKIDDTDPNKSQSVTTDPNQEVLLVAATNTNMIAPPPGFEISALNTATNSISCNTDTAAVATKVATIRPPPGFT